MNGSSGIQPTVELATTNGAYPYPVMYGNNGNNGFFGGDGIWALVLLALLFGNNGGWGNGFGGGNNDFAWLSNGQKDIMTNTNNGFDTLHLSNQLEGTRDALASLSNQLCNSTSDITGAITNGFYNTEISANNRQMADMNQMFNLSSQLANCCCENRLATCQTQNIVQNEGNSTRFADANNTRDIITNATANTQAILDKLCQLELDGKQDRINELERQVLMKDLQASQIQQTATLRLGQEAEVDALYNRLSNCPVPTTPVYGRTPIFTCNNGCGCGNNGFYGNVA
jgi:hypothetical protein